MASSCRNHSVSMAQETLFKLYSPVMKNMRVQVHTKPFLITSSFPVFAAAWADDQISPPETSCTLLLGDKEETTSSSKWPRHRLFPQGVQVLVAVLSPCRGCPALAHAEGGRQSRATFQPNTALTWKEPGPKGVSEGSSAQFGLLSQ